LIDLIQPPSH